MDNVDVNMLHQCADAFFLLKLKKEKKDLLSYKMNWPVRSSKTQVRLLYFINRLFL